MTKFTDRLEADLEQIAERATPSSTAWQAIQDRMAEPETNQTMEIIMLTDERELTVEQAEGRRRNWLVAAAAVVLAVIAAAVFLSDRGSEEIRVADEPEPEEVAEDPVEEPAPPTEAPAGPSVVLAGRSLDAGPVETDLLGVSIGFETTERMSVIDARPGAFQLMKENANGFHAIVGARVGGWYSGAEAADPAYVGEGSIDPGDLAAWIDGNGNGLIGERRPGFVRAGGAVATVYDLTLDPSADTSASTIGAGCPVCRLPFTVSSEFFDPAKARDEVLRIDGTEAIRLYFFELSDGLDPIVIFVVSTGDDGSYLDEFEQAVFPTITFPDGLPGD